MEKVTDVTTNDQSLRLSMAPAAPGPIACWTAHLIDLGCDCEKRVFVAVIAVTLRIVPRRVASTTTYRRLRTTATMPFQRTASAVAACEKFMQIGFLLQGLHVVTEGSPVSALT